MKKKYYEVKRVFQHVNRRMQTMLYTPEGESPYVNVGVLIIHSDSDYLDFPAAWELAKRGYRVLCANVVNRLKPLDEKIEDVKSAFAYLKAQPGIEKIVLLGHSGGATLMSAYQSVAENGCEIFQGREKIVPIKNMEKPEAADGLLLIDSNWGNGAMTLLSLDSAVIEEDSGRNLNPELDIYSPDNGFHEDGAYYPEEFIRKYMKAQRERGRKLIEKARERLEKIEAGKGKYTDDEPFIIPAGDQIAFNNKLFPQDIRLLSHTKQEWEVIRGDGTRTKEIVKTLRRPMGTKAESAAYAGSALATTVRTFLKSNAVLANEEYYLDETGIYGIDYRSSYCCTPGNVEHIKTPMLIMGMTAGYEFMAAEEIYTRAASKDKSLIFVEGVNHPLRAAVECERYPGEFENSVGHMFDYISRWLEERYIL